MCVCVCVCVCVRARVCMCVYRCVRVLTDVQGAGPGEWRGCGLEDYGKLMACSAAYWPPEPLIDGLPASVWLECVEPTLSVLISLNSLRHRRSNLSVKKGQLCSGTGLTSASVVSWHWSAVSYLCRVTGLTSGPVVSCHGSNVSVSCVVSRV